MSRNPIKRNADGSETNRKVIVSRVLVPVFIVICVLSVSSFTGIGVAAAQDTTADERFVRGEPDLDTHLPSNTVVPGQTQTLELVVTNGGKISLGSVENRNAVTKARNVRATLENEEKNGIEVDSGTQALGSVTEDQPKTASFQLTIPEDTPPGKYDLEVELEYSYTWQISGKAGVVFERFPTETQTVTIEVDKNAQFVVRNTSTTALIGDSGTLTLEMENVGERTAYNASVITESTNKNVAFGGSLADETYAGSWSPGERKTITHDLNIKDGSSVRPYTLDTAVSYEDKDGINHVDDDIISSVFPLPEQRFAIEAVESTLRVDSDGRIRGKITNDGPTAVESVEIRALLSDPNLYPIEDSYAVGDLEPGQTESFEFYFDVDSEAEPVRKLVDVDIQYRTTDRDQRLNTDEDIIVGLAEHRDEFLVRATSNEIDAGSSKIVTVEVTNNRNETVTDVQPKLFTDDPLSAPDDTAYVRKLGPGETETVRFEVGATEGANARTYAASIDIRYDDTDGKSKVSDTYRAAITVTEPEEESNFPFVAGSLIILLGIIAGVYLWKIR